jgi:hypothetical protein
MSHPTAPSEPGIQIPHIQAPDISVDLAGLVIDMFLLLFAVGLTMARNKIGATLKSIEGSIHNPTIFDSKQKVKAELAGLLNSLRIISGSDYACLGIMHNGQFSEWGYSFSKVTWEIESHAEELVSTLADLRQITVNNFMTDQKNWYTYGKYLCYPIGIGDNIQIAVIALSCYKNQSLGLDHKQTIDELVDTISDTIINSFLTKNV